LSPRPHSSTLFPYPTLFRSAQLAPCVWPLRLLQVPLFGDDVRETRDKRGHVLAGAVDNRWQLRLRHRRPRPREKADHYERRGSVDRKSTRLNSSHLVISYAV